MIKITVKTPKGSDCVVFTLTLSIEIDFIISR